MYWGLSGSEQLTIERRVRTYGLGAAVRNFNELAVPGLGGAWFCKQLLLPILSIWVAQRAVEAGMRVSNIEVGNAIEAIACLSAYKRNSWQSDARLRGGQKLRNVTDPTFYEARKRAFYVSQPMRMSTVEPLLALGLVYAESERFNAMRLSPKGAEFLEAALRETAGKRTAAEHLAKWVQGKKKNIIDDSLTNDISPLIRMPAGAISLLREQFYTHGEGSARRRATIDWIESGNVRPNWDTRPSEIPVEHWRDLRVGAKFFLTRDAANILLVAVEQELASRGGHGVAADDLLTPRITQLIEAVRSRAEDYLLEHFQEHSLAEANKFCRECSRPDTILEALVKRDFRILRYRDGKIAPGSAFDYSAKVPETSGENETAASEIQWPSGISRRVDSLRWLSLDFNGKLDEHIGAKVYEEEE